MFKAKSLFAPCAALAMALIILPVSSGAVETGAMAPAVTAVDGNDRPVDLAALRGKAVYVDFWASWCAPCRRSFPWMNAMHEKYAAKGLAVIAINVDRKRVDADRFLAHVPAHFAIAYDAEGRTPNAYAIKGMPSAVLIDSLGRVVSTHAGFRDEDREMLEAGIRAALPPGQ